jgi:hypothetical protein
VARVVIPFGSGQREDVDPKMMPDGALKRVENLRLRKDGRLGVRYGYTAIANTTHFSYLTSSFNLTPYDLVNYDGRLIAIGDWSITATPSNLFEYVAEPRYNWRIHPDDEFGLCPVTRLRDVLGLPSINFDIERIDAAAGGGRVCLVAANSASEITVWVVDAETDALVYAVEVENLTAPRVVAVGSVFFVAAITSAGTAVVLYRYDPASDDALTAITDAFSAGAAVSLMDMEETEAGTGFTVAIARNSTPAVTIKRFNSSGTATQTITGPATAMAQIAVFEQAARVHLVAVESSDNHVDLRTYAVSGGALENSTLDLGSSALTTRQPTVRNGTSSSLLHVAFQATSAGDVIVTTLNPSTHGSASTSTQNRRQLNSKLATSTTFPFYAALCAETDNDNSHFLLMHETQRLIGAYVDRGLALAGHADALPSMARDASTGKFYWPRLVKDADSRRRPVVSEFEVESTDRRQMAVVDGQLYISGGVVQSFAGRQIVEAGFLNRPHIISATPSNGSGSLTPNAAYQVSCVYEWIDEQNRLHQSEPSDVKEVTMGASDDTITLSVSGPLSKRRASMVVDNSSCKIVAYQSLAAPDKQLLRAGSASNQAAPLIEDAITLTLSDDNLADEATIYTQAASGARSGPNAFVAPLPAGSIWASASRILTAQLPSQHEIQESRPPFPSEPITWAENLGGRASAPERVLAIASLDERRIGFTARGLYEWTGDGLDINGVGDLGTPRRVPSPGGLYGGRLGWRSIVETPAGLFFQLAADSIFLLPRGGGAPSFVGAPVQDTLASYPVITSASYLENDRLVTFTCNNSGGTDGVLLVYDLEAGAWFTDTFTTTTQASCSYDGRLAIIQGGAVLLENTSHPASSFIEPLIETGDIFPFGRGGHGQIDDLQAFLEYRGACNVNAFLSFDGGVTYTALTVKVLTGLTAGQTVTLKWGPQRMRGDRVRLKLTATEASGQGATEAVAFNFATLDFTPADGSALRTTTEKG